MPVLPLLAEMTVALPLLKKVGKTQDHSQGKGRHAWKKSLPKLKEREGWMFRRLHPISYQYLVVQKLSTGASTLHSVVLFFRYFSIPHVIHERVK